jgi:hypothetical protein
MNLGEIQAALLRDLIQRDDVNAEALTNSVRYIHKQLQLDYNWRCMYTRVTGLVYPANSTVGVLVESSQGADDCKHIIEVFIEHVANNVTTLETLWPATQERAGRDRRIAQIAQGAQPSLAGGWNQKWYDRARRAALLIPPAQDTNLTVDFYRFLPFYLTNNVVDPTLSDWFSENLPDAIQAGAAYWLCKNILEDARADTFFARYVDLVKAANESDRLARQGGLSMNYDPATPAQARAVGQ